MNINALWLRHHALIFGDLPSNNVLISDNSCVRKSYFLNKLLTSIYKFLVLLKLLKH